MNTPNSPVGIPDILSNSPTLGGSEVGTNTPAALPSVNDAIETCQTVVDPALQTLSAVLLVLPPKESAHHAKVSAIDRQVIALAVTMVRDDPTLSGITADAFQAMVDDSDACDALSRDLGTALTQVNNTGRLRIEAASKTASEVVAVARKRAPEDPALAADVAQIDALRVRGPKAESAARVALAEQQKAAKAEARSTKAAEKSAAATARANALQPAAPASTTIR